MRSLAESDSEYGLSTARDAVDELLRSDKARTVITNNLLIYPILIVPCNLYARVLWLAPVSAGGWFVVNRREILADCHNVSTKIYPNIGVDRARAITRKLITISFAAL